MKNVNINIVLLMMASFSIHADVFKCKLATGKIVYQSEQCTKNTVQQGVVKVKQMTPEESEAAKAKLKAWQAQQANEDAAKADVEKARRAEMQQQESLDLQRRSVAAQEQEAAQAQQTQNNAGGLYNPRYGGVGYPYHNHNYPGYPHMPPYDPGYGGHYYQYPDPPKRRPGEYTGPPPHNTVPAPLRPPPSENNPHYYAPLRQH
jgi:hypothetical protein